MNEKLEKVEAKRKTKLPEIPLEKVEEYIEYYEKLIQKKVHSNINKIRRQALKNIQDKFKDNEGKSKAKNLQKRMEEIRAFYEGDIIKMDAAQKDCTESKKVVKWYEWDMVMVIPNPDYYEGEGYLHGEGEEAAEQAEEIYKK